MYWRFGADMVAIHLAESSRYRLINILDLLQFELPLRGMVLRVLAHSGKAEGKEFVHVRTPKKLQGGETKQ